MSELQKKLHCGRDIEEITEDMDLGCLGIHFSLYDDGRLMLYMEKEFARAMGDSLKNNEINGINPKTVLEVMREYCIVRDRLRL